MKPLVEIVDDRLDGAVAELSGNRRVDRGDVKNIETLRSCVDHQAVLSEARIRAPDVEAGGVRASVPTSSHR